MISAADKLLQELLRRGPVSRAELAKLLKLSRPAISTQVEHLLNAGILEEKGCGNSTGGKPPILLELNSERFSAIGIDIGHESLLRGVLTNSAGIQTEMYERRHANTFESILGETAQLVRELQMQSAFPVKAIGIALAGQVDHSLNEVVYCGNFPLKGGQFAKKLEALTGLPVHLENRARAAAKWEYYAGAARNTGDFLFLSAERGIGTAIYLSGKLFTGRAGVAGEIHDLLVPAPDQTGLLPVEQALNEKFLMQQPNSEYLVSTLTYIVRLLTNLLDPALIVLGGRLRDLDGDLPALLSKNLQIVPDRHLHFTLSHSGRIGAALGAALDIVIQNLNTGND